MPSLIWVGGPILNPSGEPMCHNVIIMECGVVPVLLGPLLLGNGVLADGPFPPVPQEYLFEARQLQALSFAVHIPLVCFGMAFPVMVLYAEWRYLRDGDPLFRTLAKRWSKVM